MNENKKKMDVDLHIRVDRKTYALLCELCRLKKLTKSELIRGLIRADFDNYGMPVWAKK